jgi:hypothetical protein
MFLLCRERLPEGVISPGGGRITELHTISNIIPIRNNKKQNYKPTTTFILFVIYFILSSWF